FFKAIKMVGISPTLAMLSSGALMTAVLEPIVYKRKFLLYELVFGVMALSGMILIFNATPEDWTGMFLALIATFLGVLFTLINGKLIQQNSSTLITFYQMMIGFVFISLYLLFTGAFEPVFFTISAHDFLWLLILGTVCTAYAITGAIAVMRELNPFTIMLIINMEPLYGIVLALVIFGESELMNTEFYLGLTIILTAIFSNSIVKFRNRLSQKD
ncbi:MAG: EamA family transporter, partial [Flavobacteriaceae bacterium]